MKTTHRASAAGGRVAFSVVELLVTTSIIALLVALLLPAFSRSRERSRKVSCQGVLHQVYLLTRVYADDHEGEMPLRSALFLSGEFPRCPSSPRSGVDLKAGGYSWIPYYFLQRREKVKLDPNWVLVGDRRPWHDLKRVWHPPPDAQWTGKHNLVYGDGRLEWTELSSPP